MQAIGQIQIGKQGLTDNFLETLESHFQKFKNMKIKVLKGASPDKKLVKTYADKIIEKLGPHYTAKVIGFTIFVKKWRKEKR
jgi:RNA-binding protein YhbY